MKFDYFMLAEGANQSTDHTQNILGAGRRVIDVPITPVLQPVAIVGGVSASPDEIGEYRLTISLTAPGADRTQLVASPASIEARTVEVDPTLPVGFLFQVLFPLQVQAEGLYIIRASVGRARAEYRFHVRIVPPGVGAEGARHEVGL
jgi:hypothetical protein